MSKKTDDILACIDVGLQEAGDMSYGGPSAMCVRCDSRVANDSGWCDGCMPTREGASDTDGRCSCPLCQFPDEAPMYFGGGVADDFEEPEWVAVDPVRVLAPEWAITPHRSANGSGLTDWGVQVLQQFAGTVPISVDVASDPAPLTWDAQSAEPMLVNTVVFTFEMNVPTSYLQQQVEALEQLGTVDVEYDYLRSQVQVTCHLSLPLRP